MGDVTTTPMFAKYLSDFWLCVRVVTRKVTQGKGWPQLLGRCIVARSINECYPLMFRRTRLKPDPRQMLFGFLFILLTVSFALVLIWYMVANNFAKETLDVAYPAIGAMIVSIYLGSKAIYIDAPPPQEFLEDVPILLDFSSGYAHGVPRQTRASLMAGSGTDGARAIETAQYFDEVKALNLPKKLRKEANSVWPRVGEEIIEYAILTWLAQAGRLPVLKSIAK